MLIERAITDLLQEQFNPVHLKVLNESHMHAVPPNSETHFKLVIASSRFDGLNQVKRHQSVYGVLQKYMNDPIHALALHTFSPSEWEENSSVVDSPDCLGGGKAG